jgi:hypothetical protein
MATALAVAPLAVSGFGIAESLTMAAVGVFGIEGAVINAVSAWLWSGEVAASVVTAPPETTGNARA